MQLHHKGDPGFFFGGVEPLGNSATGRWGKQILSEYKEEGFIYGEGGGIHPIHPLL